MNKVNLGPLLDKLGIKDIKSKEDLNKLIKSLEEAEDLKDKRKEFFKKKSNPNNL